MGQRPPRYRTVTREAAHARWYNGVPEDRKRRSFADGVFDAWADATFASDPEGAEAKSAGYRAPNGVMQDCAEYWWVGKSYYDPAKIAAPALLVTAAWDSDVPPNMARTLLPLLVNRPASASSNSRKARIAS